jgi:hypothetical protein
MDDPILRFAGRALAMRERLQCAGLEPVGLLLPYEDVRLFARYLAQNMPGFGSIRAVDLGADPEELFRQVWAAACEGDVQFFGMRVRVGDPGESMKVLVEVKP